MVAEYGRRQYNPHFHRNLTRNFTQVFKQNRVFTPQFSAPSLDSKLRRRIGIILMKEEAQDPTYVLLKSDRAFMDITVGRDIRLGEQYLKVFNHTRRCLRLDQPFDEMVIMIKYC